MGRIKKSQIEQQPADLQSVEWINTPFSLVKFGKGFSLIQQQALIKVSEALQTHINKFYNEKQHLTKSDPNGLIRREVLESMEPIRMYASDFGVGDGHYAEVFEAFKIISMTQVKAPEYDENGNYVTTKWYNVFSHFSMPETDKGYTYTNKDGNEQTVVRYEGYAEFAINTNIINYALNLTVADYALNMKDGYVNHPARLVQESRLAAATLLYFLVKHSARSMSKVKIAYRDVQEMLGTKEWDKKTGEVTRDDYPLFSKFKQRVLDKVCAEIKRMAVINQADITFEYEPVYRGKVKRGDPEWIEFTIQLSDLGKFHNGLLALPDGETRRRGRPRKQVADNTPSLFDGVGEEPASPDAILADLRYEFGNGQQGYDYYFGPKATCKVIDGVAHIGLPSAWMVQTLQGSFMASEKLHRCLQKFGISEFVVEVG